MNDKKRLIIMRNALQTILFEAAEPIIRVYAKSALDETIDDVIEEVKNNHCIKHNWFGEISEKCPLCNTQ